MKANIAVPLALIFIVTTKVQTGSSAPTNASPTYVCFDLNLNGFTETDSMGVASGQQVGYGAAHGSQHALLWSDGGTSIVDLNPAGFTESLACYTSGTQQVGFGYGPMTGNYDHALLWSGSPDSIVDLNPDGYLVSAAYGICGNQEVGYGWGSNAMADHALIWSGSASNVVDIHPNGFIWSYAFGTSGDQQVGYGIGPDYNEHALLWSGTAASAVDLNPTGFTLSQAVSVYGARQAGLGSGPLTGNNMHALLWSGTASSVVDLNPTGFSSSICRGINGNYQVGGASGPATFGNGHAILWSDTPDSAVDLHGFLSSDYGASIAAGIDANGNIAGAAYYLPAGGEHAIVWVPLPNSIVIPNDPGEAGAIWTLPTSLMNTMCNPGSGTFLPVGTNIVTYTITNSASSRASITHIFTVTVKDSEPPTILEATATPQILWPPNNHLQPVTVNVSATDNCHVAGSKIISVTSNESDRHGRSDDWEITSDLTLNLRASRIGTGAGRIYTITVQCTDDSGNASTKTVNVTVPRSQFAICDAN